MAGITRTSRDVDVEVDPVGPGRAAASPASRRPCARRSSGEERTSLATCPRGRCDVDGLVGVPRSQHDALRRRRRGAPGRVDPCRQAEAERDGERHVGALAGGRRPSVVDVHVPVDIGDPTEPMASRTPARARGRAEQQPPRTSGRSPAPTMSRIADRTSRVIARTSAEPTIPVSGSRTTSDADVEVAAIRAAETLDEPSLAQRSRRVLGPAGTADRVDGNPERCPRGHGRDASSGEGLSERSSTAASRRERLSGLRSSARRGACPRHARATCRRSRRPGTAPTRA